MLWNIFKFNPLSINRNLFYLLNFLLNKLAHLVGVFCVLLLLCILKIIFLHSITNFSFLWVCMRLRCSKITKREVMRPVRKYVKRMIISRNNNGGHTSNNAGRGTVVAMSFGPIPSSASTMVIPSTRVVQVTLLERTVLSPIPWSHPMTPRPIMATEVGPFAISITMPMLRHEQPYWMPTSMIANLHTNPTTFADNAANMYSSILTSSSAEPCHPRWKWDLVPMQYRRLRRTP